MAKSTSYIGGVSKLREDGTRSTYDDGDRHVIAISSAFLGTLKDGAGIETVGCPCAKTDASDIGQGIGGGEERNNGVGLWWGAVEWKLLWTVEWRRE